MASQPHFPCTDRTRPEAPDVVAAHIGGATHGLVSRRPVARSLSRASWRRIVRRY